MELVNQWGIERSSTGWKNKRTYYAIRFKKAFGAFIAPETAEGTNFDYVAKVSTFAYSDYLYAQQDIARSYSWVALGLS